MTTEAIEADPELAGKLSFEQPKVPQETARTVEIANFYGGVYGLGIVALTAIAAQSREPYRASNKALNRYGGISGLTEHLSSMMQPHEISETHDLNFTQNMVGILEGFSHPTSLKIAHEIAKGSPKKNYCSPVDVDIIGRTSPAVIAGIDHGPWRADLKNVTADLTEDPLANSQPVRHDRLIDVVGAEDLPNTEVHSIPWGRELIRRTFGDRLNPYLLDSASLLLGVSVAVTQNSGEIRVFDKNEDGKPKISSVSY